MARTPSNADILQWTEESLRNSHLERRLKPLFEALGLQHLDRDDPARGDRRGKSYAKADYVRALLAHQQAVRDAGATSATFSANEFVQFRSDAGTWQLAYVAAVGDLGGSPIYTLRQPGGADIMGIAEGRLRALPEQEGRAADAEPILFESGDMIQRRGDPAGVVGVVIDKVDAQLNTYHI